MKNKQKKINKNEEFLRDIWNTTKSMNVHIMGALEG